MKNNKSKIDRLTLARLLRLYTEVNTDNGLLIAEDDIVVGAEVFMLDGDGTMVPAVDGVYTTDEMIYTVESGIVTSIESVVVPVEETPEVVEPVVIEEEEVVEPVEEVVPEALPEVVEPVDVEEMKREIERLKEENDNLRDENTRLKEENEQMKTELETLREIADNTPAAEPVEVEEKKQKMSATPKDDKRDIVSRIRSMKK